MKFTSAILLFTIIFLQTFSRLLIHAEYFFNQSYIATTLCENKNKPQMHCMGKCFLDKQLKKQEKQEQRSPFAMKDKLDVQLFVPAAPIVIQKDQKGVKTEFYTPETLHLSSYHTSIFHPPALLAA